MTSNTRTNTIITLISGIGLLVLFATTKPLDLPSAVLVGVFVALFICLCSGLMLVCSLLAYGGFVMKPRIRRHLAIALSALIVFLVVLRSVGQLTPGDVLLGLLLMVLLYAYIMRMRRQDAPK